MSEDIDSFYNKPEKNAPAFCRQSVSTVCSICTKMVSTPVDKDRTRGKCKLGFWKSGGMWNPV